MQVHLKISWPGKTKVFILNKEHEYTGELDTDGNACGFGEAIIPGNTSWLHKGTFLDNGVHGICKTPFVIDSINF